MAKGASKSAGSNWNIRRSPVNIGGPWPDLDEAEWRVLEIQTKLHQWATDDPNRCFDDLFNLVYDPAFLVVAWERVGAIEGARSAGVDGVKPCSIVFGREFLAGLRDDLKARRFVPLPVRERMIPKPGSSKRRRLGIPTARDRTVQAPSNWCSNLFSRRIYSRAVTVSAPDAGLMTPSPRSAIGVPDL